MYRLRSAQRVLFVFAVAVLVTSMVVDEALGCPSCKQALADSKGGNMIAGYFWSILFMMSMPFTLLGGFSGYMYLLVRRARNQANKAAASSASVEQPVDELETVDV
ncbi:MAG: hypothetical protein KF708_08240 [Pirellulales bacterium]|nr:hypothetical protein [Pirellulales bacterium]